ncbi:MAG: outer membrane beta-barrel protein [Bacteroidota bacterium]
MHPYCTLLLLFCWLWSNSLMLSGQSFSKKNSFSFFYTPMYSKTGFTNLEEVLAASSLDDLLETKAPKRGIYGYSYGLHYQRRIVDQWAVGLGVQYALHGQRSPQFYSINGVSDKVLDDKPDYGGILYKITYSSYEFPLYAKYHLKRKRKLRYFLQFGGLFNIYLRVQARDYIISRGNGMRMNSNFSELAHANGTLLEELQQHVEFGMWRLGFMLGGGLEYEPWSFLSLAASPEFRFYTNLKDTSEFSTLVEGGIYSIGIALSAQIKF